MSRIERKNTKINSKLWAEAQEIVYARGFYDLKKEVLEVFRELQIKHGVRKAKKT